MYYDVDNRIATNGQFTATFTIVYYDHGTDSWVLQYDGASNAYTTAGRITKTNTDT